MYRTHPALILLVNCLVGFAIGIKSSAVRARARAVEHRVGCKSVLRDVANNVPSVTRLEWVGRGVDDDTACAAADAIKCAWLCCFMVLPCRERVQLTGEHWCLVLYGPLFVYPFL